MEIAITVQQVTCQILIPVSRKTSLAGMKGAPTVLKEPQDLPTGFPEHIS